MRALNIAIAAMISLFYISVMWVTTQFPFNMVITQVNATVSTLAPGGGAGAINTLVGSFTTALIIFPILAVLGIILWWFMKMQEREVVTEAYYG